MILWWMAMGAWCNPSVGPPEGALPSPLHAVSLQWGWISEASRLELTSRELAPDVLRMLEPAQEGTVRRQQWVTAARSETTVCGLLSSRTDGVTLTAPRSTPPTHVGDSCDGDAMPKEPRMGCDPFVALGHVLKPPVSSLASSVQVLLPTAYGTMLLSWEDEPEKLVELQTLVARALPLLECRL